MSEEYLTREEVMQRLKLTKSSLYRRIGEGTLPSPIKLGHLSRFRKSEVEAAIERLAQKRPSASEKKGDQQ